MRLKSPKANTAYIDQVDREGGKPEGKPVKGHTVFYFRALSSQQEGALQDSMFDMSRSKVSTKEGNAAKVDMSMNISPSRNRHTRVRMAMAGFDNLYGPEDDKDGKPIMLTYAKSVVILNGEEFDGVVEDIMDIIPSEVQTRMERFVRQLSAVEPGEGNS